MERAAAGSRAFTHAEDTHGTRVPHLVVADAAAVIGDAKAETVGFARPPGSTGLTVGFSSGNVQAIITALERVTDTTLLANPKVLAVNKQEGIVYIGRKIGYESQTTQTQTSTTQSVEFLETGTRLAFRPFIGNDGYIRMDIYPKDSDGALKQNNIPDETSTELRTNVVVKDGQTLFTEFMVVREDEGGLVLTVHPEGQRPVAFRSQQLGKTDVIFANAAHDFPQRIVYHRRGGTLFVRAEGEERGEKRELRYKLRRIGCD